MVVMRCISVQQIVRSDIQAGRKILQQLNRAAEVSRFNFCKMVRANVQHYTQLFLRNSLLFPQIADTSAEFFCIKSHCSILSFAPKTQTGRDSFSESRPVFSLKITNRFWFLLTPNIRQSLYLQSKDLRSLEKFWTKKMGGVFVDTIKRVQDLMQVRDMTLCVLAKKCGISYSTIQTTARRGRAVKRRDDWKNLSGFRNYIKRLLRFLLPVNIGAAKKPFATLENLHGERL